jgi:hypothetical protein
MARSGISAGTADRALLRRVDSRTGAEIVGRAGSTDDYSGIVYSYQWPGEDHIRAHRLRLDHPKIENGKPKNKYLSAPGQPNMLYFPPGTPPEWLYDSTLPLIVTEGEKKVLALSEVAFFDLGDAVERPRWLVCGIAGVQCWRGKIGKVAGPNPGDRLDEVGPISDLNRLALNREVIILFDGDVNSNESVRIARLSLAKELRGRSARVRFVDIPQEGGVNGIDDLLYARGPQFVLSLISSAYDPQRKQKEDSRVDIDQIPAIRSFDSAGIEFVIEGLIARGSVTMLSGESGHGKSTVVTGMADAIANGKPFAGRVCSQRQVLILDRENGIDVIQERFNRLGIEDENGLKVWGGWLESEAPIPGATVILDWVAKTVPKPVVIVDSVIAFLDGNENSASEVREFMKQLRLLANAGATVIALHHTGKAETSQEYRGSSDFKGSIDVGITVRNFGEGELGKIRLKAFKGRFAIDRDVILIYQRGQFTSDNRTNAAIKTVTEQLTSLLEASPGIKKSEFETLAAERQLGRNRARAYLDFGVATGEITFTKGPRNARFYNLAKPNQSTECQFASS